MLSIVVQMVISDSFWSFNIAVTPSFSSFISFINNVTLPTPSSHDLQKNFCLRLVFKDLNSEAIKYQTVKHSS